MHSLSRLLVLTVLAGAPGCSSFRAPTVTVNDMSVTDATEEALALSFVMEHGNHVNWVADRLWDSAVLASAAYGRC